jgi:hypothetical protein
MAFEGGRRWLGIDRGVTRLGGRLDRFSIQRQYEL